MVAIILKKFKPLNDCLISLELCQKLIFTRRKLVILEL